jgi:hypothetical protein
MKKSRLLALSLILSFSLAAGCKPGDPSSDSSGETKGDIMFWSASTAETVLLEKNVSSYEKIKKEARIDVEMAKNEYEGAQIFMTALSDVGEYFVDISDLKSESGEIFSAENIDVYAYKYVETTSNPASHRNIGIGHYPDAILPIDASVKFGENKIKKGDNQGVYVRFQTLPETEAGVYTGSLTIRYDGKSQQVPIFLNVWDLTVSEETRSKTLFSNKWAWESPELDSTDEKFQAYIDLLTEYRISSINLMNITDKDRADEDALAKAYAEKVYDYASNHRNSTYALEYSLLGNSFNVALTQKYILAIAEKSFETDYNCLSKATFYCGMLIDEATMQGRLNETITVTNDFRTLLTSASSAIRENKEQYISEYGVSEEFVEELAKTAESIPHVFVSNYNEDYAPYINEDGTGTGEWCPNVWEFQEDDFVDKMMEIDLDWWYGCGGSSRPIPSYQMDDYTLSPRLMSWQQIYYGIVGNLYWATNVNQTYNGVYKDKEDYYDEASIFNGIYGDGQLIYPGGQYELFMPVATRRLEAIRDGLEEYELLLDLKNKYATVAQDNNLEFSFDEVYEFITAELFNGININASAEAFDVSRNLMFQLLSLANSEAEVCITDFNVTTTEMAGKCFVKDGYTLKVNNTVLSGTKVDGGTIYSFEIARGDYKNACELSIPELKGQHNTISITSNGKASYYEAENTFNGFKNAYVDIEKELVDATVVSGALSEQLVKVSVAALSEAEGLQGFKYVDENIVKLGVDTSSMTIRIYNGSGSIQKLSIEAKYKGDPIIRQLTYAVLQEGWNTVEIKGIDQKIWNNLISIEHMLFIFEAHDNGTNPTINDLYFDGYYITYLKEVD